MKPKKKYDEHIRERIKQLLEESELTVSAFCHLTEVESAMTSTQLRGGSKISLQLVMATLGYFSDISEAWLLFGTEPKIKKPLVGESKPLKKNRRPEVADEEDIAMNELIAEKDARIRELQQDKENLMCLISNMLSCKKRNS